jgi:hypothetical protein
MEKDRIKKILERYVRPEAVEAIMPDDGNKPPVLTAGRIEFVLVYVTGSTPEEVSARVGKVAEIAAAHGGTAHGLIGALVVVAYDTLPHRSPSAGKRAALVGELTRDMSGLLKIVHGAADGHYGIIGSGARLSYSFILPKFDAMLGRLGQMDFGQIEVFEK